MTRVERAAASPGVTADGPRARPLRVCLLIGRLGMGGAEKQVVLLARGLRRRGVHTTVLAMFGAGERDGDLHAASVPLIHLGFRTRAAGWHRWPANARAFARLVRHLRAARPDVLHAFLLAGCLAAAPAALVARVPSLVAGRRSLGDFKDGHPWWRAAERLANRATDLVVANAEAVAEDARRREGLPPRKVAVVRNGLPESAFEPASPAELRTVSPVVLCVANFWRYKGHQHLLDAVARLRDDGLACTLVLVGRSPAGDPLERDAVERRADWLGIDVRFLGARTDVRRLLARADLFALPSLTEGMSNAVMEAMAAGVPVVATDVGGTRELIGDTGVLVPPGDPDALAAGIAKVLGDPGLAARLGEEGRARSRALFHADTMIDQHLALYHRLRGSVPPGSEYRDR